MCEIYPVPRPPSSNTVNSAALDVVGVTCRIPFAEVDLGRERALPMAVLANSAEDVAASGAIHTNAHRSQCCGGRGSIR